VITRQGPQREPDHDRDCDREKTDEERHTSAEDDARQDITALGIGAQRVFPITFGLPRRRLQPLAKIASDGAVTGQLRCEKGYQNVGCDDQTCQERNRLPPQLPPKGRRVAPPPFPPYAQAVAPGGSTV